MPDLLLETALVDGRWAHDVRVGLAADGTIGSVEVGPPSPSADGPPSPLRVPSDGTGGSSDAVRVPSDGVERVPGITVPGVPNVHGHAFQRALAGLTERGSATGDTFWSWRERMYAFLDRLGPDQVEAIAAQLYVELLRHGFTSMAEFHYLRNDPRGRPYDDPVEMARRILSAAQRTGMGTTLLPTLYCASGFGGAAITGPQRRFAVDPDALLDDLTALRSSVDGGAHRVGVAFHSLRAVPPEALTRTLEGLGPPGRGDSRAPIHIHVAEQRREVDECVAWSGARPVAWLLDHAPVDARWCLVHGTHLDAAEIAGIAGSGAVVGLCPTTEANLGDGLFPLTEFQAAGGAFAIGTDSHVGVSPVGEIRMLEYGQRLSRQARNVAAGGDDRSTGRTLLDAVYAGGRAACGRPVGAIEVGARADLVVLDADHPALVGRSGDAVVDSWLFSGDHSPVRDVMVAGVWRVRDGRHEAQEAILAAYTGVVRRLAESS